MNYNCYSTMDNILKNMFYKIQETYVYTFVIFLLSILII